MAEAHMPVPVAALAYRAGLHGGLAAYDRLSSARSAAFLQPAPQTITKDPGRQCDDMRRRRAGIRIPFIGSLPLPFSICVVLSKALYVLSLEELWWSNRTA